MSLTELQEGSYRVDVVAQEVVAPGNPGRGLECVTGSRDEAVVLGRTDSGVILP